MTGMEFAPVRHALTITLVQQLSAHSNNFDGLLINRFPMFSFSNNGDDTLPGVQTAFEMVPRETGTRKFPRGPDRACIFVTADLLEFGFVFHS